MATNLFGNYFDTGATAPVPTKTSTATTPAFTLNKPVTSVSPTPIFGSVVSPKPNYSAMSDTQMSQYLASKPKQAPLVGQSPALPPMPTLADFPTGQTASQNFGLSTKSNSVYDSTKLSPGALQDLEDMRQAKEKAMMSGTNLDGSPITAGNGAPLIPSDTLQGKLANQLYQSKLYTPEEQSLIQGGQDLTAQINAKKLAARRKAAQLLEDGAITREQASQWVAEGDRRANQELADLSVQQDSNTAKLTALGLLRQNQVGALEAIGGLLKGSEVAPGSSVYNPITGVQYQGTGAGPGTIETTIQNMKQNDQMTGNLHLDAQGGIDENYYYQQAVQRWSGGGQTSGVSSMGGTQSSGGLPQQVQTYLNASGGEYINDTRIPAGQRDLIKQLAAQNGIPYLEAGDVAAVQSIDYTKGALAKMSPIIDQILADGVLGKVKNIAGAKLNSMFPTSVARTAFIQNRDTAIKNIQSLVAGTGSGFRLTQPEIDQAVSQMPKETDTLSVARANIAWINSFLDNKRSLALTGKLGPQTPAPGLKTGGSTINTKVGPVDNSWFQ